MRKFEDQVQVVVFAIKDLDTLSAPIDLGVLQEAKGKIDLALIKTFDNLFADAEPVR